MASSELDYTLFRPFNWIGADLTRSIQQPRWCSRVITQFIGHIVRGEPIQLVDGGSPAAASLMLRMPSLR